MTWNDGTIAAVLERLRRQGNDDGDFEAKSCSQDIGNSVWETVSAFANTAGGTLLLGVSEKEGFIPVDGFGPNRIISQFIAGMGDGNPQGARLTNPPEYEIFRCEYGKQPLLAINVKENPATLKPCYITAKGPQSGGYRRVDDKDIRLTPTEIFEFENMMTPSPADRGIVTEARMRDLDEQALDHIVATHQGSKALRGITDRTEQLARLNILDNSGGIRLAGLLAAGQYPQQYYPKLVIDVAVHPHVAKAVPAAGPRFLDRILCEGNMPEAIDQAVEATAKNLRTPTFISGAGAKTDTEIPREVLREVIANAVVHREYDARFTGQSIAVDIYPDRVEVSSPGGLWGGVTVDNIANGESRCRNATLMQLLHQIPYQRDNAVTVEGNGSGIPMVIAEMQSRALGHPKFEAHPDRFKVILARYGVEYPQNQQWLGRLRLTLDQHEQTILLLLRQHQSMSISQLRASLHIDSDEIRDALGNLSTHHLVTDLGADRYSLTERFTADSSQPTNRPPSDTELAVLESLSTVEPRDIHTVCRQAGKSLASTRKTLRSLIDKGLVTPTAPATSKNRKYLKVEQW